ncbi:hypothetical protein DD599_27395 [Enterobacter cloacae complex sp. CH23B]|nr:hypothetical protein DD599_27395 [Enterobacter cloacae complex sp. CH23B]
MSVLALGLTLLPPWRIVFVLENKSREIFLRTLMSSIVTPLAGPAVHLIGTQFNWRFNETKKNILIVYIVFPLQMAYIQNQMYTIV